MLLERLVAYLLQKKMPITHEHLCGLATTAGYSTAEIQAELLQLAKHEYVLREEWYPGKVTFEWVKDTVEYNRAYPKIKNA